MSRQETVGSFNDYIISEGGPTIIIRHCEKCVTSPNFLVWKFCGKAQFSHSFGRLRQKLCGNGAFPQNFHTRKLGENYGVFRSAWWHRCWEDQKVSKSWLRKMWTISLVLQVYDEYQNDSPKFIFLWSMMDVEAHM